MILMMYIVKDYLDIDEVKDQLDVDEVDCQDLA